MGRPRAFDEDEVIKAAARLFAGRAYDGISVDDLVAHLGVHRNSLYKVFGSKRGLYLAALRWYLEHEVGPLLANIAAAPEPAQVLRGTLVADDANPDLDLLLMAAVERAPADPEVADEINRTLGEFDAAVHSTLDGTAMGGKLAYALVASILGLRLRARTGTGPDGAGTALFDHIHPSRRYGIPMAQVRVDGENLLVEIEGLDKLWALKSRLEIPLVNVRGATADPGIVAEPKGVRWPGAQVPGVITAGTFHIDGERVFWDVHDSAKAIVIELHDDHYARLVIEVADPRDTVALIERAITSSTI
jgi:TetR/AcrR family transcriptional repressor of nem operon